MLDAARINNPLLLDLEEQEYSRTHELQLNILQAKSSKLLNSDIFIIVEHPPVFTLGKRGGRENILVPEDTLKKHNIAVKQIERGGDVTYHGPGQLVVYPILDLRRAKLSVPDLVWALEEIMLKTAHNAGVSAKREFSKRGAWVQNKKLGSVGIAIRQGITFHGLALNVDPWLEPFSWINPCGMEDVQVTSLAGENKTGIRSPEIRSELKKNIQAVLQIELNTIDLLTVSKYMDSTNNYYKTRSKPDWFKQELPKSANFARTKQILSKHGLCTVCEEAKCPNAGTCFSENTATFLIMGPRCSRDCAFCAVKPGPQGYPDPGEGKRVALSARDLGLDYVVVTSVTRDDLPDGGAKHFAETIRKSKQFLPKALVEVLIPDLQGSQQDLQTVLQAGPDVLNHNLETVGRLYPQVRPQADYQRSLEVLRLSKELCPDIPTKSGLMLGLGETAPEIETALQDLLSVGCKAITMGQYLRPSKMHTEVARYVTPEEFSEWKDRAHEMGFHAVASGPRVRSSYKAKELYQEIYKTRESL